MLPLFCSCIHSSVTQKHSCSDFDLTFCCSLQYYFKFGMGMNKLDNGQRPPVWWRVIEIVILSIATLLLATAILTSGLGNLPNADQFGFLNTTPNVLNNTNPIGPAGWTFAIWGVIFIWQALFMLYAWSFVFRPSTPRTVSWISLLLYTGTNVSGIFWAYIFGNGYAVVSLPFLVLMWAFMILAIGVESVHLYKLTPRLLANPKYKINLWITRMLAVNGMGIYATWLSVAKFVQFTSVLQGNANINSITAGAVSLWLLTLEVLGYFALENTILDRFIRFIYVVYPGLTWALIGVLAAHWGQQDSDTIPVLILLIFIVVIILMVARVILVIFFVLYRPLVYTKNTKEKEEFEIT